MKLKALSAFAILVVACSEPAVPEEQPCTFSQDISQPLSADMVYEKGGITRWTIQGFDIDAAGNCYLTWEQSSVMCVKRFVGGEAEQMTLPASAHGDGFSLEQNGNYFWTSGTLGKLNGYYSGAKADDDGIRLICRFRFEANRTKYTENAEECFYINANGCRIVSLDEEHDAIGCWTYDGSAEHVLIYRLSDLHKASRDIYKVDREIGKNTQVEAYDLNTITPLADVKWNRREVCGDAADGSIKAIQGFCIYDGCIYVMAGTKDEPWATLSVLDWSGNFIMKREKIGVSADRQKIIELGLSENTSLEPEGIHIHKGVMYIGFSGDFPSQKPNKKHSCIIRLK